VLLRKGPRPGKKFPGFFISRRVGAGWGRLGFLLLGLWLTAPRLWAWGSVGHRTIAYIAQDRLTPRTREKVREILGPGQDLASVSVWADAIVVMRPETAPWHYLDLDVRQDLNRFDLSEACRNHDCVVDQVEKDLEILRERFAPPHARREALKFLVHFVGDLHQPLHCADDGDRGGNEKWLRYRGPRGAWRRYLWVNLHGFWDNLLEPKAKADPRHLAFRLEREITPADEKDWRQGGPSDWAYESFRIARDDIYSELPEGPLPRDARWGRDLPEDYNDGRMWGGAKGRLERAGVRLAWLLNGLWDGPPGGTPGP
jgi:nuclease S1